MNKRGIEMWLAMVILAVVGMIVMLMVLRGFQTKLGKDESKVTCSANLLLSALTSKVPFAEQVPVQCRMKLTTINKAALDKAVKLSEKDFERMKGPQSSAREYFDKPGGKEELALNSIVANELTECWNKVIQGKLNLFSTTNYVDAESICVVCSQLIFDNDLPSYLASYGVSVENQQFKQVLSLDAYLRNKAVGTESAYDFLARGQTVPPSSAAFVYSPQIPYSVVYMEIQPSRGQKIVKFINDYPAFSFGITVGAFVTPWGWAGILARVVVGGPVAVAQAARIAQMIGSTAAQDAIRPAVAAPKEGVAGKVLLLAPFDSIRALPAKGGLGCGKVFA